MSDIEKSRRYPPDKDKIETIAKTLELTEDKKIICMIWLH